MLPQRDCPLRSLVVDGGQAYSTSPDQTSGILQICVFIAVVKKVQADVRLPNALGNEKGEDPNQCHNDTTEENPETWRFEEA